MNVRIGSHLVSVHKWTILFETLTNDSLVLLLFVGEETVAFWDSSLRYFHEIYVAQ